MKKALALILTLIMVLGLMPAAMAATAPEEGEVTITKSLVSNTPDDDGNYTIKLTVQGNPITQSAQPNADVVLVVDNSGSMASSVGDACDTPKDKFENFDPLGLGLGLGLLKKCPTCGAVYSIFYVPAVCTGQIGETVRINAARGVGKTFAENILKGTGNKMAVIGFAGSDGGADESQAIKVSSQGLTDNLKAIEDEIDKMSAEGGTNYTAALQKAYAILNARSDDDKASRPGYVIFISDGAPGAQGASQGDSDWDGSKQVAALKNAGITIYTIGIALDENSEAYSYLKNMASKDQDDHFKNVSGTDYQDQLNSILNDWADDINTVPAGTNAVMTDVINSEYFEYVSSDEGLTYNGETHSLTWNIGDIPEKVKEVTFKVKPKDGWTGTEETNKSCTLTYTKPDKTEGSATAPSPTVTIAATTGKIVVTKNVVMPVGDNTIVNGKEYSFTITWEDGTYSETKKVTIGDNNTGSVTFENVPFGNYTVTESDAGMQGYAVTTTSDPANGTVTVSDTADGNITFTNTYTPETIITYPVQIKKEASGLLEGTTYPNVTVDIKQGEKVIKTITGLVPNGRAEIVQLPAGEYTVEERRETAGVDGYILDVKNAELKVTAPVVAERSTAPDAVDTVPIATITNTYTKMEDDTGSLTVKKTVSGGGASYNKEFTFTVTLTVDKDPQSGEYGGVTFTNGVATFTLKHNQEKSITGIPAGYTYTVTENADGYTQSITSGSATGTIEEGKTATVTFNNYKSGGDHYYPTPDPVPPIVIPPNTGDMTIWQSILHFLGIR